ncbi:MAG: phosphoglycerate mutase (2,3-diphosphoglycerate-independent) [Rhodospirillales bacterium RIFCSPLOWO2_12_FULL_58_28]|nr:MAG: phosphoglycerate mutase (2,3-diphosphoglycerate-independent) [Rhodospirillales bacterium RIFCSPLOWO2_02_FULL_58_16]OHC79264.1 MAG: phosphoglycerate mutase (2,3-diphosphoglycerate-independent) [Rhodospirillales bacterium RIFCSPLOWO2_12_FULL_58_28]
MHNAPKNVFADRPRPAVLCILDGWGARAESDGNAIALGDTPNWDRFLKNFPHAALDASGGEVGLPAGQMGNSEVGHMNLGAGRVVLQDLPQIDEAVAGDTLATRPALVNLIAGLKKSGGVCHMLGLLSPGGVHSHQDHMAALARIICGAGVAVAVHAFLDGRDTPPRSAKDYMERFLADTADIHGLAVATIGGRYYGMDRDNRWPRVEKAFLALTEAEGDAASDPLTAINNGYDAGLNDEFIMPCVIDGFRGMKDGDGILHANFRADRARELLHALTDKSFDGFKRRRLINFSALVGMESYSHRLDELFESIFPPRELADGLGEVVSNAGLKQLRISETEKYAHVTFFFNGGREKVFPGEERILVASPKVATYDLQPAMSAIEVTDKLVKAILSGRFDLIVVNYANGDMVGHTGFLSAAVQATETIDMCLGRLEAAIIKAGGVMLVTADHGNCEQMIDHETEQPHTAHTLNPVPIVLINGPSCALRNGRLADVAPTMLRLMGLPPPDEMTGRSLIVENENASGV